MPQARRRSVTRATPAANDTDVDRVERWPLDRIRESRRNPRAHSAEQIEALAASMREFGWTIPVLIDESGELLAGYGRLKAARVLWLADAPVLIARGWTDAQKRVHRIADRRLALNASSNASILFDELAALSLDEFAIDLLGFSDENMARLPDDTDRIALDRAAQSALAADSTDWRTTARGAGLAPSAASVTLPHQASRRRASCGREWMDTLTNISETGLGALGAST